MPLRDCVQAAYIMFLTQVLLNALNVEAKVPQARQPSCFCGLPTPPVYITDEEK